jgi:hypothetical protein
VFWKDEERYKVYVSDYNRQLKTKNTEETTTKQWVKDEGGRMKAEGESKCSM